MGSEISRFMFGLIRRLRWIFFSNETVQQVPQCIAPQPKIPHFILDSKKIGSKNVFAIGDVHGCYDELIELIRVAGITDNNTILIFLGDMINKGPKGISVLNFIKETGAYAIRGNHEDRILRVLHDSKTNVKYIFPEKLSWTRNLTSEQIEFISSLPYSIEIPSLNCILVHAGIVPGIPLSEQNPAAVMYMRNIIRKQNKKVTTYIPSAKATYGEAWFTFWTGPKHIYYGHDARRGLQVRLNSTGLDTGCVYGGKLTGVFINGSKSLFSVDSLHVYEKPDDEINN